jgi:hypothetical protein
MWKSSLPGPFKAKHLRLRPWSSKHVVDLDSMTLWIWIRLGILIPDPDPVAQKGREKCVF